ncbi:MAG: FAD-dependent oxidoreductase [Candidatus Marinimicrobia bacterium]|nr:FAD-dependent oxidoreductase [Candidatus Neomarinimicrobiota bacterium]
MNMNFNLSEMEGENKAEELSNEEIYDVLILGAGPAGMTAAVYCMRKGVNTGLLTDNVGGQVAKTSSVENYMGYRYIEGSDLVQKFQDQVKQFPIGYKEGARAIEIQQGNIKKVITGDGNVYQGKSLVLATGKSPRWLNVPGEDKYMGRGIAVCAICDAPLYKDKDVIVVGGGNSGAEATIDLAKVANHITIIQDKDRLTADRILLDKLNQFDNFDTLLEHKVTRIFGTENLEGVEVKNIKTGEKNKLDVQGVFVEIGWVPNSEFIKDTLSLNRWNEINIDCACRTSEQGIFAAGDVSSVPYKQIIAAAGDGAKAALSACEYVMKK